MSRKILTTAAAAAAMALLAGSAMAQTCSQEATTPGSVCPTQYPGNFVASSNDQVCYEMSRLGYIGDVTSEMRGFKIDPPVNYNDGYVNSTLNATGKYLSWTAPLPPGAQVQGFIIKGGPNYNVYNYVNSGLTADGRLHSPANAKGGIPQISHYNVCYTVPPVRDFKGCTPGYWRNHADRWTGVALSAGFNVTFGVTAFVPDQSLAALVDKEGQETTPQTQLAFHAVAALLNSYGGIANTSDGATVQPYRYTTAQVIAIVQAAFAVVDDPNTTDNESTAALLAAKNQLAAANEDGCPLGGTSAQDVCPKTKGTAVCPAVAP